MSAVDSVCIAFPEVQSDVVAEMMANYYSWEKFVRNVCGNMEDDDMQAVLMNLGRLVDLQDQNFYPSLMRVPGMVARVLSKIRPDSRARPLADTIPDIPRMTVDAAALQLSLAELGRVLGYPSFLDFVHGALGLSNKWSLVAIQHSVAAWARLHNDVLGSGLLSCDDGSRKFRKLDTLLQEEVLCTCYAFLGKDGVADIGMVNQIIREQYASKVDKPLLDMEAFLTKLHRTHSHFQKALLTELICSENVWKRTFTKLLRKSNS